MFESGSFLAELVLLEGSNEINWTCLDIAGNLGRGVVNILVDTQLNLSIARPSEGEKVHTGYVEVSGMTDPNARIVISARGIEAISNPSGEFSIIVWFGFPGEESVAVEAIDDAGNKRSVGVSFIVVEDSGEGSTESSFDPIIVIVIILVLALVTITLIFNRRVKIDDD
jgi:hypothetical protein